MEGLRLLLILLLASLVIIAGCTNSYESCKKDCIIEKCSHSDICEVYDPIVHYEDYDEYNKLKESCYQECRGAS